MNPNLQLSRDDIERCEWAYYRAMRELIAGYQTLEDAFPQFVKGFKRIVATICSDGGVIFHWPSDHDEFEYYESDKTVFEVSARMDSPSILRPELGGFGSLG